MNIDFEVAELKRKFSTLFSVGTITQINEDDTKAKVKFGEMETGFLRIMTRKSEKKRFLTKYFVPFKNTMLTPVIVTLYLSLSNILSFINNGSNDCTHVHISVGQFVIRELN